MPIVEEIKGDLIVETLAGKFEVIAHCCNCFCTQKKGFALQMVHQFQTNQFPLEERESYEGDYDKLGRIEFKIKKINDKKNIWVVNMYGQYHWKHPSPYGIPLDYDALRICFRKLNYEFKDRKIGIPGLIGCRLAGGDPKIVKQIINEETPNCQVTIVYLEDAPF